MKRLPDSELEIMQIIWEAKKPVSRQYIQTCIGERKDLAATTVLSFLSRLEQKGFVFIEKKGKSNSYTPLVAREDYIQNESKTILERFFGNSLKNFVVQLNDSKSLDAAEIEELKKYLDDINPEA